MDVCKKPALSRLERVDLRQVWTSEPYDFTPWLAEEENLRLLGEALDVELALVQSEQEVGAFSCDILAKDMATDTYVAIENQLESTDHTHLGQLLTYAAGLDAVTVVWVSRSMRDEHRQALDWLNSKTSEDLSFFGVEVELWRIGESATAPRFNVVSRPNTYQKAARQTKEVASSTTESGQLYLGYFVALREYMAEKAPQIKMMKPLPQAWTNISIGRTGYHLNVVLSTQKRMVWVTFIAYSDANKAVADLLTEQMPSIESAIPGAQLDRKDGKKQTGIEIGLQADPADLADRPRQMEWIARHVVAFDKVFRSLVRELP